MSALEGIDAVVEIFRKHDCPVVLMHPASTYSAACA
jgi:sialic acid synthase SpsE